MAARFRAGFSDVRGVCPEFILQKFDFQTCWLCLGSMPHIELQRHQPQIQMRQVSTGLRAPNLENTRDASTDPTRARARGHAKPQEAARAPEPLQGHRPGADP